MKLFHSLIPFRLLAFVIFTSVALVGCGGDHDYDDSTPPTVISTDPANDTLGVYPTSSISITFSESMDQVAVESALTSIPDLPEGDFSWDLDSKIVTFTPNSPMDVPITYVATLGVGATDTSGNPLEAEYSFSWRTSLPYTAIELQSDFDYATGSNGVFPSLDGKYFFWHEGFHFKRVKVADLFSELIWDNTDIWGTVYDDGIETWAGTYSSNQAARVTYTDPITVDFRNLSLGHTFGLSGNDLRFPYVYFGNSQGQGIGYWNRETNATGKMATGYISQSAVMGDKIYFPTYYSSTPGIYVIDAVADPTTIEKTLFSGETFISNANDICSDDEYLYVRRSDVSSPYANEKVYKIDPSGNDGAGEVLAEFLIDSIITASNNLTNIAVVGNYIYSGVQNGYGVINTNVYIIDKESGAYEIRDCSEFLTDSFGDPAPIGMPKWDYSNDGLWFGPSPDTTLNKWAFFIPREVIENGCVDITPL